MIIRSHDFSRQLSMFSRKKFKEEIPIVKREWNIRKTIYSKSLEVTINIGYLTFIYRKEF